MPTRSTVAEVTQIGVEVTPGTAVAATKRLASLSLTVSPDLDVTAFTPAGSKNVTVTALNTEDGALSLEGQPTYDEVIYPLSAALTTAVVTAVMDGGDPTGAHDWVFTPNALGTDNPKTLTIEQGQATRAQRVTYGILAEVGMEVSRSAVSMSGSGFSRAVEDGVILTPGVPQTTDLVPILPGQFCAYYSSDYDTLGDPGTKLTRLISANPSVGDRFAMARFIDCAVNGFGAVVETANSATLETVMEANADGMGFLPRLRNGETGYFRLLATGPIIAGAGDTATRYEFEWDMAVKVSDGGGQDDSDGVYGVSWTFAIVHDGTENLSHRIRVRNKAAAL